MTGYKDYLFLLRPDENMCREIANLKCYAASIIGDYKSKYSTAHISVIQYSRQKPYIIEQSIDNLNLRLKRLPAVKMQLNNFNYFVHKNDTYTIYAMPQPSMELDQWFDALRKHFKLTKSQFVPHITIARTLPADKFLKLWPHFKYNTIRKQCLIYGLTVLERETLDSKAKWDIYKEVSFKSDSELLN